MGAVRNGARSFLDLLVKLCKLSHMRGFSTGVLFILGGERGGELLLLWEPLCTLVESLVAIDDNYNRVDVVEELDNSEDQELI